MYVNHLGLVCLYVFDVAFDTCTLEISIGEVAYITADKHYTDRCPYINQTYTVPPVCTIKIINIHNKHFYLEDTFINITINFPL